MLRCRPMPLGIKNLKIEKIRNRRNKSQSPCSKHKSEMFTSETHDIERKTEEDVVTRSMRNWQMKVIGSRKIARLKLRLGSSAVRAPLVAAAVKMRFDAKIAVISTGYSSHKTSIKTFIYVIHNEVIP